MVALHDVPSPERNSFAGSVTGSRAHAWQALSNRDQLCESKARCFRIRGKAVPFFMHTP